MADRPISSNVVQFRRIAPFAPPSRPYRSVVSATAASASRAAAGLRSTAGRTNGLMLFAAPEPDSGDAAELPSSGARPKKARSAAAYASG